jgi:uncharacterized protein YaaR (DUF327 family)
MNQYKFEVGQVYTIEFFQNKLNFTVTKINSKGVTLKNEDTRIELKDYKELDLGRMIVKHVI